MQSINMELAQYSELFMLIAAFIYTAAFMLFAVDMIRSSATIRRVEDELAAENAAERELVGAESSTGAAAGAGTGAGADQPVAAAPADELVDDGMAYLGTPRPFANVAVALTVLAVAAHTFAVAARGIAANRVPWANMYEFLATGALVVAAVYLLVLTRKDVRFLGTFALGLVVTMMAAATIGFPTPLAHVQPALQTPWIAIHVSLAVLAISLFTLTFAMNVLQLIQHRRELAQAAGETTRRSGWQFLRLVPSATSLENWAYRMNAVGFVFWTLGPLITGAIWAEEAWGRYWGWDVKEVWTFVIWVVYAGYLHARATRGWTGNRAAWLSIIGYGCIIFNYAVVNIYFPGLHSYAGLPE
ncbi:MULTISPECIES: c-type cytochrome biogenesis protein CcsB [unclassified Nesterenkonia]|uniref:c-type cytochrome biogenesis protein CcsB n=1 Tax=unclassified Nesterenkonia TaxID=2629769 RepID=UPI001F4CA267|nr:MULTISPECIES: c-type cytochrome biogenesis protein CcsB [unclassified Nesterenkonia]MCH8560638.1 c-type cytochrome biogenesis protein CcsB [Nesterenkonia sp. DZ6]MCH8562916.1 c-type cytochrome biogenesis protein CcsB [Nesterenkonia sp. YGD6]MCH8570746.1 c-type cytochrome biogenesis protein CcsB [Nesterenkonia sp. AY15]